MTAAQRWAMGIGIPASVSVAIWLGSGAWSLAQAQGMQDATLVQHGKALERIERKLDLLSDRIGGDVAKTRTR